MDLVIRESPEFEGAVRFETACRRGHYLAFLPPTHLRVVSLLHEEEGRILDFVLVDFASTLKFKDLDEASRARLGARALAKSRSSGGLLGRSRVAHRSGCQTVCYPGTTRIPNKYGPGARRMAPENARKYLPKFPPAARNAAYELRGIAMESRNSRAVGFSGSSGPRRGMASFISARNPGGDKFRPRLREEAILQDSDVESTCMLAQPQGILQRSIRQQIGTRQGISAWLVRKGGARGSRKKPCVSCN